MHQKLGSTLMMVALVFSLIGLSPAPVVHAGSNGQLLFFYIYSGKSNISWLQVVGTNQQNRQVMWSRSFNQSVSSFSLDNWWWKGRTDVQWRMADGRTGACTFILSVSQPKDWNQVGVDRQPGNTCWVS